MIHCNLRSAAAAAVLCLASASASAGVVSVDVSGIDSWDAPGSANNTVMVIDVASALGMTAGSAVTIDGIGWDVVIDTFGGPSWLSEATVQIENSDQSDGLFLSPGAGDDFGGGPTPYSSGGILDITSLDDGMGGTLDLSFELFDGLLRLEFSEGYDDAADVIDAAWVSGTLDFRTAMAPVPLPAALPLLLSALGIGAMAGRRRKID